MKKFAYQLAIIGLVAGISPVALSKTVTTLPKFSLPELGKPTHVISPATLPKQPFLLTAWASWCGACREENAYLVKMKQQGYPIVGLNYQDETADAKQFLQRHANPFMLNIQDQDDKLVSKLGILAIPTTLVVDGKGTIWQRINGQLDAEIVNQQIAPCLNALKAHKPASQLRQVCR